MEVTDLYRAILAVGLLAVWVLFDAGPRLADAVVPDPPWLPTPDVSASMHIDTRATILADATARQAEAIASAAAREQLFSGVFSVIVLIGSLATALRPLAQRNPVE